MWRAEGRPDLRISPTFSRNDESRLYNRKMRDSQLVLDGWTLTPGGRVFQDYHRAMLAAEKVKTRTWEAAFRAAARTEKKSTQSRRAS